MHASYMDSKRLNSNTNPKGASNGTAGDRFPRPRSEGVATGVPLVGEDALGVTDGMSLMQAYK